ncbi:MAG: 50S ribosomal protein L11 methyltransferase [Lentisphaerae bacterium]|nr:50S ribosomal protein L11 methyltransferase [Lentisphaerota bacterium]
MGLELTISDVAYGGRGIGREAGRVVFVPGVITGEKVLAQITGLRRNYAEADLLEILQPASERIAPACPLADTCPGCCYQHLSHAGELRVKQAQLSDLLRRLTGITDPVVTAPTPAPQPLGYRNKIVLHQAAGRLGYFARDNRTLLDVPQCPLAHPAINRRLEELRGAGLTPAGNNLTLRHTERDGVLHWSGNPGARAPWLYEQSAVGEIRVPRGSFFQVHPAVARALTETFMLQAGAWAPQRALDIYCGVGVFAMAAARAGVPEVRGIDNDSQAIRAARHNARQADRPVAFQAADAGRALAELADLPAAGTMVMLDPPRTGLDRQMTDILARQGPEYVMYCSCAPDTLARDLARIMQAGYRLETLRMFDMFPRTMYCECLAGLRRAPAP